VRNEPKNCRKKEHWFDEECMEKSEMNEASRKLKIKMMKRELNI
jgi:hypothetical protein